MSAIKFDVVYNKHSINNNYIEKALFSCGDVGHILPTLHAFIFMCSEFNLNLHCYNYIVPIIIYIIIYLKLLSLSLSYSATVQMEAHCVFWFNAGWVSHPVSCRNSADINKSDKTCSAGETSYTLPEYSCHHF